MKIIVKLFECKYALNEMTLVNATQKKLICQLIHYHALIFYDKSTSL